MREDNNLSNHDIGREILNIEFADPEIIVDKFTGFLNDMHIACNYHKDYTVGEMLGVMKFLLPVVMLDDNIEKVDGKHKSNLFRRFMTLKRTLQNLKDQEDLSLYKNIKIGQADFLLEMLVKNIDKFEAEKNK
jgi:aspartyl/asparaginyl beta-hydroxylase (cupin superfamily)